MNTNSCAKFKLFVLAVTQVPTQSVDTSQPLPAVFPPVEEPTLVVNLSDVPDGTLGELEISQPICVRTVYETIFETLDGYNSYTVNYYL